MEVVEGAGVQLELGSRTGDIGDHEIDVRSAFGAGVLGKDPAVDANGVPLQAFDFVDRRDDEIGVGFVRTAVGDRDDLL